MTDHAPALAPAELAPTPAPAAAPAWPRVGAVLSGSFDLLTRSRIPLRNGSLYIALIALLTMGLPLLIVVALGGELVAALLASAQAGEGVSGLPAGTSVFVLVAGTVALGSILVLSVESQILGVAILGGAQAGRSLSLREALRRSRAVFWRVARATILVNVATMIVLDIVTGILGGVLGDTTDAADVGAQILTAILTAPFIYVVAGIVLGDVAAIEAIRRSIRLARARFRLAVIVSVFAVVAQYLLIFAAFAGLDLAIRLLEPFRTQLERLDPETLGGILVVGAGGLVALVAFWTLTFTVGALSSTPQVVAFLGLTGYSAGLDSARDATDGSAPRERAAWITRPMLVGIVLGGIASVLAVARILGG